MFNKYICMHNVTKNNPMCGVGGEGGELSNSDTEYLYNTEYKTDRDICGVFW